MNWECGNLHHFVQLSACPSQICVHVLADERTRVTKASFAVCSQLQQWMWDFDKARWSSPLGTDQASTQPASWDPCWLRPSGSCRYVPVSVMCLGTSAGMFLFLWCVLEPLQVCSCFRDVSWNLCWYVPVSVMCLGTSAGMFLSL